MSQDYLEQGDDVDPGPGQGLPSRERDYIVPAQDTHGNSVRLYCRAMPTIGRLVADVVANRKYPFRTHGDLIRWCIVIGVKKLASGAGIESVTAQSDAMIAVLQDEEFQLQFKEAFVLLKRMIDSYMDMGAANEARRLAGRFRSQINAMPEGFWKKRYHDELITKHGQLLDAEGAGVSFGDEEEAPAEATDH